MCKKSYATLSFICNKALAEQITKGMLGRDAGRRLEYRKLGLVVAACWQLARPRLLALVLFTVAAGALVSGPRVPPWTLVGHAVLGSAMAIVGALAWNHRLEGPSDAAMQRTLGRPLVAGQLSDGAVTTFAGASSLFGLAYLTAFIGPAVAAVALTAWLLYVCVYTPMKRRTAWQTPVGAVAGAMPVLLESSCVKMRVRREHDCNSVDCVERLGCGASGDACSTLGSTAAGTPSSVSALTLFGAVFFWQLPHAMAIAWLYRNELADAGIKVASVVEPTGRLAGLWATIGAAALLPVGLLPVFADRVGWGYGAIAAALGLGYLAASLSFLLRPDDRRARMLLQASFLYLPAVCAALVCAVRL